MPEAQILVDVGGRHLTGGDGADGCGRPGDAVASGEQVAHVAHLPGQSRHERAALDGDTGLLEALDLDALSDGHYDDVGGDTLLRQVRLVGPGTARLVGLADELGLHPQRGGVALLVGLDAYRRHQRQQLRALGHCARDLVWQGGHVLHAAAVDAGHLLRAQADRAAGHVHGHVAAADDHHPLAGEIGHHVVTDGAQHLHGGQDVTAVLAGDTHLLILMRADGDVETVVFLLQLFHGDVPAHGDVCVGLDAEGKDGVDLLVQQMAGEAVAGDAVAQHAAQLVAFLEHRCLVAHQRQIIGAAQAAGSAADNGHLFAGGRRALRLGHNARMVHSVALQPADVDGVVDHIPAAAGLTGVLADVGAGRGERIILSDEAHRVGAAPLAHQRHVAGHVHPGGAEGHAGDGQLQAGKTAAVVHVLFIVVAEALQAIQHQAGRVAADGAVSGVQDAAGRLLDDGDGVH